MTVTALLSAATAVVAVADWWAVAARRATTEMVAKPTVMLGLIAIVATVDLDPPDVRPWVIAALVAGLIGDVCLLPTVDAFVAGLAAFLVGHLCYLVAAGAAWSPTGWLVVGLAAAGGLVAVFARPVLTGARRAGLLVPVAAYLAVTLAIVIIGSGTGRPVLVLGTVLFATSDGLIGRRRFVEGAGDSRLAVIVMYHLGQAAIVAGFALPAA
jgi:uncharacterized membrane protein YhhN